MNIASWFAAYRIIEAELERERAAHAATRTEAAEERQKLIDGYAAATGRRPVFQQPPEVDPLERLINSPAVGPSATAAREAAKRLRHERIHQHPGRREPAEEEIEAAAAKIVAERDGSNGHAEPPEPIGADKSCDS